MRSTVALMLGVVLIGGCNGRPEFGVSGERIIDVQVSAGAPVRGAAVTIYAITDATAQINTLVGNQGIIGTGGPTDASGQARVKLLMPNYSGPIQVTARGGTGVSYVDPTLPMPADGIAPRVVEVPVTFLLTTYVADWRDGSPSLIPVTLMTTLADQAVSAYASGRHPGHPERTSLRQAMIARDTLFVRHVTPSSNAWAASNLRTTVPAALREGPQGLNENAYAALTDVGLNRLAGDVAIEAGYAAEGQLAVSAITLVQLLSQDLAADGRLDGAADGGRPVAVASKQAVRVDSMFLRKRLAESLDRWINDPSVNKSGISRVDLAAAQVYAAISTDCSDLFGEGTVKLFDPVDREPPVVSLLDGSRTIYSGVPSVDLRVRGEDKSGVENVYAQIGTTKVTGVAQGDGTWLLQVPLSVVGHNQVVVWGTDPSEAGGNSGFAVEGHGLVVDVVWDASAPSVSYDDEFASYSDERGMTLAVDAKGWATIPATYVLANPKTVVGKGGEFFKAATRLSGGTMDVAELETTNAANIPILRFVVPLNEATEAPIVFASYKASLSCSGCAALPEATGALLPSSVVRSGFKLFDLPLAAEQLPALRQLDGPGSLSVVLELRDAAGNSTTSEPYQFTFHVVGPPLAIAEDTGYWTYGGDLNSGKYRVSSEDYKKMWDPTALTDRNIRLVRYVVTNPVPQDVAVAVNYEQSTWSITILGQELTFPLSWTMEEKWVAYHFEEPTNPLGLQADGLRQYDLDGFSFTQGMVWAYPYGSAAGGIPPPVVTSPWPCPGAYGEGAENIPAHRMGDKDNQFTCLPEGMGMTSRPNTDIQHGAHSSGYIIPEYYDQYATNGEERSQAIRLKDSAMALVPKATPAGPGVAVIYLTRSVTNPRARPLEWGKGSDAERFETWEYQSWTRSGEYSYNGSKATSWYGYRRGYYLAEASDHIRGTLEVTTRGFDGSRLVGEPLGVFRAAQDRNVGNHH